MTPKPVAAVSSTNCFPAATPATRETAQFEKTIGNIGDEMVGFATAGSGSSTTGGLFGGGLNGVGPADISRNCGASMAAFNIMALLFGKSGD